MDPTLNFFLVPVCVRLCMYFQDKGNYFRKFHAGDGIQWHPMANACHPSGPGHMCDLIGVPIMASLEGCRLDELEILPNGNMAL